MSDGLLAREDDFPADWLRVSLGEIVSIEGVGVDPASLRGQFVQHFSLPAFDEDRAPTLQSAADIKSLKFVVHRDSVLLSKLNPGIPRVWLPKPSETGAMQIASTEFLVLVPRDTGRLSRRFLYHLCLTRQVVGVMARLATGTSNSHQRVTPNDVLGLTVALPDIEEQLAIADVLDGIDDATHASARELRKVQQIQATVRETLLRPGDGGVVALGELADINPETIGPGTPGTYAFRYIDISAVSRGRIHWPEVLEMRLDEAPSRARRVLRPGDVLFSTVRALLQSHAYFDAQTVPAAIASTGFAVLRARRRVSARFLFHVLFSTPFERQVGQAQVGTGYPAVNEGDVKGFKVPNFDYAGQTRIAEAIDRLIDLANVESARHAKLTMLKNALLAELLAGRRRLPGFGPDAATSSAA